MPKKIIQFPRAQKWLDVRNVSDDSADLYLYDVIGDSWIQTDSASVVREIVAIKSAKINVHINSPGGSVFDGVAIYNALRNHSAEVTTHVDGLAASIASIIALAGDNIVIAENAMMMIHNPWSYAAGESKDFRKMADALDQIREALITTYTSKTGKSREVVGAAMDAETWFTASEARDYGLVDSVVGGQRIAAQVSPEIAEAFGFSKAPTAIISTTGTGGESEPAAGAAPPIPSASVPRALLKRKQALIERAAK